MTQLLNTALPPELIKAPGNGGAIPTHISGIVNLITAGAETRTLSAPKVEGKTMQFNFKTDGGDCVITVTPAANQTGNNTLTFADAGDHLLLQAARSGTALVWRIVANDGVALTTV